MATNDIICKTYETMSSTVIKALESRGYEAYFCPDRNAAREKTLELIEKGSSVSCGGSRTLVDCGIIKALSEGDYTVVDRNNAKTAEEKDNILRAALTVDTYLSSVNAMTEDGIMINIDGNGNRIAAIAYGPKNVILDVGMNKICHDTKEAHKRAKHFAAPANAIRLSTDTPCAKTGICHDCKSPACICCQTVEMRFCREKGRIKVLLVGEPLGL